ncbi:MAG: ABC transporter ATP-binding protein [Oligoflexus sp.]
MQETKNKNGLLRLLSLAYPERRRLALGTVFLLIGSAMLLVYPQVVKKMIDEALTTGDQERINQAAVIMLGVFLIGAVAGALRYYLFTVSGEKIVAGLRSDLYRNITQQEIAFFDSRRTGELMSRLSSDAAILQNAVSVNLSMTMRNLGSTVGGIILLIYTSPVLTFGLLAAIPPIALGTAWFGRMIRRMSRQVQDALAESGTVAEETISGIRTVRAFAKEEFELHRYRQAVEKAFHVARKKIHGIAVFTGFASLFGYAAIVGVVWYGGQLVITGDMSIGDLSSFILYTLTVAMGVATLGSLWTDFMSATGAAKRVFELLDRQTHIPLQGGTKLAAMQGAIDLNQVSFSYPARPDVMVLSDLSLHISPGEMVALVGPSGGGKSTIAALISRFYDPNWGSICLDGHDLRQLDSDWLHAQIGVVAQDPVLLSTSLAANIRYGKLDASDAEVEAAARAAHAHEFIMGFPQTYETVVGERGIQLSGGQRQRIAIARAMLKDPKVLVLDEATSALDAESEYLVQDALDRLLRGRTTVVIAHRLSTVRSADRVLVIDQGQVVQEGRHEALMAESDGTYYKLVQRQFTPHAEQIS